jgi:polysaccharide biosynthesis/export protein
MRKHLFGILVAVSLTPLAGPQEPASAARPAPQPQLGRGVVIGPEDSVTIQARDAEEISRAWRVSASGELNLPLAGRIHVAGMTAPKLEVELTRRLKRYIRDPQVSVWIAEFRSQPVTITGAVARPGTHQLQGPRTLFEVLILAGGPTEAGPTVTVTRSTEVGPIEVRTARTESDGRYHVVDLPLDEVMNGRTAAANLLIHPYDIVSVSPPQEKKLVHILGEVIKPGAVELVTQDSVSLMKVVSMAGGMTRLASPGNVLITHVGQDGGTTESATVNLKKIMTGKAQDLELSAGDVVVVPSSQLKAYLQVASTSVLNAGGLILGRL